MAKLISDEKMKFSYVLDGNQAQKDINDLEKSTRKLTEETKGLILQKKLLEKQGKVESAEYTELISKMKAAEAAGEQETEAYKELLKEKKLLEKQNKRFTAEYSLVTKTIADNNKEIKTNKVRMSELQKEIGLTGLTMNQLQRRVNELKTNLRNLVPGTELYEKYKRELGEVSDRMKELSGNAKEAKSSIGAIADGFNRYAALAATVIATLTGVVLSIQKVIDYNGKLADAYSDVQKTTGMTRKEVDELSKSFGLLKTRTERINLLKIAEEGGRIGVVKEEIADFVNVMNKAAVALGDSFTGGVGEVAAKLGKLKFLFKETKDLSVDEAYNKIGSSINDLGAAGVASEANIAEFATRVGSLPEALKPSIANALALGAAFEESGLEAEVSSRAYNIFLKQASTESAKFAKVMGISQKEVERMINTDPLEFFLHFSEGLQGMDATDIAKTLDFLGVNADGANKALGAVANNSERFREQMNLSNESFAIGTSLIKEYDIKNNNFAATLEKLKKHVVGWYSSETFVKWLTDSVNWIAKFVGAVDDTDGSMAKWKTNMMAIVKIIGILIATTVSYTATNKLLWLWTNRNTQATALYNLVQKAKAIQLGISRFALLAYEVVLGLVTLNMQRVTAATIAFNVATKSTPLGLVLGLITAVAGAYYAFSESAEKATAKQITFAGQMKQLGRDTSAATAETKANITALMTVIKDETVSIESRKKAYEELVKISPVFNGFLKDEKFNIEGLVIVYEDYLKALDQVAYAKSFANLNVGNIKKQIAAQQELYLAEKQMAEARKAYEDYAKKTSGANIGNRDYEVYRKLIGDRETATEAVKLAKANLLNANKLVDDTNKFRNNQINVLESNIKLREKQLLDLETKYGADVAKKSSGYKQIALKLEADRKALEKLIPKGKNDDPKSNYNIPDAAGDKPKRDPNKTDAEMQKERLDDELKFQAELLKLKRQAQDDEFALMKDGYAKEEAMEVAKYQREVADLEKQRIHKDEMAKLDVDIAKAKKAGDVKYYDHLIERKKGWGERNQILDDQIQLIVEGKLALHRNRLGIIQEKGAEEEIRKGKERYDLQKTLRETKFNQELAALGKNELAKAALKKKFQEDEMAADEKYLKELLVSFNDIISKDNFGGIDLDLLTPEQVDKFTKEAAKVGLTLSELIAKRNELAGKDTTEDAAKLGIGDAGQKDVFGFTIDQWTQFYANLQQGVFGINEMTVALQGLSSMWSQYNQYVEANENRQLKEFEQRTDKKKKRFKQMLDAGIINQAMYTKQVEKLDDQVERQKADIEYKQAKRKKTMSIVDTVINTSVAIMQAYSQLGPIGGTIAAVLIGTLGALQIATISKQPLPARGYEKGLYGDYVKREQDGKVFKSKYRGKTKSGMVNEPSHFLVAENGPEMVIDNKAWSRMNPKLQEMLIDELRGIKGFEKGYYKEGVLNSGNTSPGPNNLPANDNKDKMFEMAMHIMSECTEVLKDLRDNPISAVVRGNDYRSMKELQDGIEKYNDLINKTKK